MTVMAAPKVSESAFLEQVLSLAAILGWESLHLRHAFSRGTYRVATQGTLGKGWPDLVLVRPRDRRLVFAELKADDGKTTPEQDRVLDVLRSLDYGAVCEERETEISIHVWRPRDFDRIAEFLR